MNQGIVGLGTVALDRIRRVPRIAGPDSKVRLGPVEVRPGGATANHLAWAACLGIPASCLGVVGQDDAGHFLLNAMRRAGIDCRGVHQGRGTTAVSEIFVDPTGERAIYMDFGRTADVSPALVRKLWRDHLSRCAVISLDLAQVPLTSVVRALRLTKRDALRVIDLDVPPSVLTGREGIGSASDLRRVLEAASVLKPTLAAAAELTGKRDTLLAARALAARGFPLVLVTDGARGAAMASGRTSRRIPAFPTRRVADATGAGDAFLGGFLAGMCREWPPAESARLGAACGSVCVETVGAFPPPGARANVLVRAGFSGAL